MTPLWIACVGSVPGAETCDAAIDLAAPGVDRMLTEYTRARPSLRPDGTALDGGAAVLPLLPGASLTLYHVEPLTTTALAWVMSASHDALRHQRAFLCACWERQTARGEVQTARPERQQAGFLEAPSAWLDRVAEEEGHDVVSEVGQVAIDRARLGPKARAGYSLPRGLTLAR